MRKAVYNSAIPAILRSVSRAFRFGASRPASLAIALVMIAVPVGSRASDWNEAEQQLARKIVAVTGPGAVAVTVENRSSLGRRDSDVIQNGLHSALEGLGVRYVAAEQAAATVMISLSENPTSYVWVAEIRQGAPEPAVVMVSLPRIGGTPAADRDSVPLSLRKALLWTQDSPILDVAVLEENGTPSRIAVLEPERISLYRLQNGKWQQEQQLAVSHGRPWPRDLRGRLLPAKDHPLDAYLPGVACRAVGAPLTLNCHDGDDPWPLVPAGINDTAGGFPAAGGVNRTSQNIPPMQAFFAPTRNFFTGVLTPAIGKFASVPKFYSAAYLPRDRYTLWLFAATDGRVHIIDGLNDQSSRFEWGSDIATVKTSCGVGWQVLATSPHPEVSDSVRAYEFPDRSPVAVSAGIDFPGVITALWTEGRGDTAVVIVKDQDAGGYEAFRLAVVCGQ